MCKVNLKSMKPIIFYDYIYKRKVGLGLQAGIGHPERVAVEYRVTKVG